MHGGKIFSRILHVPDEWRGCRLELFMRECFERNGSAPDDSKTSCKREAYRAVPKYRTNAALIGSEIRISD